MTHRPADAARSCGRRPSTRRRRVALVLAVLISTIGMVSRPSVPVDAAPTQIDISTPGPLGAVTVIGDSVLLGSAVVSPTLADRLVERGWGPIKMRAGEGYFTGYHPVPQGARADYWLGLWRSQGWDAPNVIVNLGANDSGICITDPVCARNSILHVVDTIGPGRQIWWPQITRFPLPSHLAEQENWNAALRQIAAERPNFHTWNWPAEMPLYQTSDNIHLTGDGYRIRSARMAEVFTLDVARGRNVGAGADLPDAAAPASSFVPVESQRLVDTRSDAVGRQSAGDTLRIDPGDAIPPDATAVALYVAAAGASGNGYLTAGPCGRESDAATVNFTAGPASGAPTLAALGDGGDVCVFASAETDVVVDLQGAFVPDDRGLELDPLATPRRLHDTRTDGRADEIEIEVGTDVDAVAVNLAATGAEDIGFLRAGPCGETIPGANLNYRPGPAASSSSIVGVSEEGTFCVTASTTTDVVVDLTGTFSASGRLSFVPVVPTRTLDTRDGTGGWFPVHGAEQVLRFTAAPEQAQAVTGTLTVVRPSLTTYVAGFACDGDPPNASANAGAGSIAANSLTSAVTASGELCLLSSELTTTVFDTTGWWI